MSLPPLPVPAFDFANDAYTEDQMKAYGQACRNSALDEAVDAAIDACGFNGASVQLEAHIRKAIEELK